MTSIEDERQAAEEAKAVVSSLAPSTSPTEAQRRTLRKAATIATRAAQNNFSSQRALNDARGEVATALFEVSGLSVNERLTHETITRAKEAIEVWLNGLAEP